MSSGSLATILQVCRAAGGGKSLIDVSEFIGKFRVYVPLTQSPELFRSARVGEYGADAFWTDVIDMSADRFGA